MTKRDYIFIAEVLNRKHDQAPALVMDIAGCLADMFKRDNPRFQREQFLCAVRGEQYVAPKKGTQDVGDSD